MSKHHLWSKIGTPPPLLIFPENIQHTRENRCQVLEAMREKVGQEPRLLILNRPAAFSETQAETLRGPRDLYENGGGQSYLQRRWEFSIFSVFSSRRSPRQRIFEVRTRLRRQTPVWLHLLLLLRCVPCGRGSTTLSKMVSENMNISINSLLCNTSLVVSSLCNMSPVPVKLHLFAIVQVLENIVRISTISTHYQAVGRLEKMCGKNLWRGN